MQSKNIKVHVDVEDVGSFSVSQNGKTGDVFVSDYKPAPQADKFGVTGNVIVPETGQSVKYVKIPGKDPTASGYIPPGPTAGGPPSSS